MELQKEQDAGSPQGSTRESLEFVRMFRIGGHLKGTYIYIYIFVFYIVKSGQKEIGGNR